MINPVKQSFVASANLSNTTQVSKEGRAEQGQKVENDRFSKIEQQIKSGEYKMDLNATAKAITEELI